jgi:hypothetical protein
MREEAVMSDPLPMIALIRELARKEFTLAILDAEAIKLSCVNMAGQPDLGRINREIMKLEKDCSDLSIRIAHEADK